MTSLWRHLWPNYNTLDFKILTQCVKLLGERVLQVWWWYLHWFRRYRKKTRGGARNSPPSGARVNVSDGRVPRGQEAIPPVRSAAQVRVWQKGQETRLFTKIERSLGGDFRRFPEGQEGPGLCASDWVRQKDRRTLSWVESGQVDTAKWKVRMVLRRTPRFQEGTESSYFRKRCAGEGNNGWLGRRWVRVAKGAEQVRMALEWLTESCEQVTGALNRSGGSSYVDTSQS